MATRLDRGPQGVEINENFFQGETYVLDIRWLAGGVPINLTGYTAIYQVRDTPDGSLLAAYTETNGIALGGALGTVKVTIPRATTATFPAQKVPWELTVISSAGVATVLAWGTHNVRRNKP